MINELKKCFFLIILLSGSVAATAQEDKVSVAGHNITIKQAFEQIESQSKYTIAYNSTKFDSERKVILNMKYRPLKEVLSLLLKGSGFTYKLNENHIVIVPGAKETETVKNKPVQTVRGIVKDAVSGEPLPFVSVVVVNTAQSDVSDSLGRFSIKNVPVGRYDLSVSFMGYEPLIVKEQLATSAKEGYCEILLREKIMNLEKVVVRPSVNKEQPLNPSAFAGARMFSVEEANRFAGGFDDPARLVSSFAGVAGNVASNSISVHGNSPQFLQWRMEGVEIPNPTHFADMAGLGGGIFTALSSQVMGNSDFLNGAFPAEYNNALSGVFDMSMRTGNNYKHEHTVQVGLLGFDFASEGPLSKKYNSSYIVNYRYSATGLLGDMAGGLNLKYQDISFKLNFPARKAGTFSVWGIGLVDANNMKVDEDCTKWKSYSDRQAVKTDLMKMATGIGHKIFIGKNAWIKTSLAATYSENKQDVRMTEDLKTYLPVVDIKNRDWNLVFTSSLNKKFSSGHTNRTGITVTGLLYDLDFNLSPTFVPVTPMDKIVKGNASSAVISAFTNSTFNITEVFSANIGVTAQLFLLNNNWSVEPRAALRYKVAQNHAIALAYGLHSRREKLDYYYVKTPATGDNPVNINLDFAKAHHLVLSYDWGITENMHLKVEPYYQYLYNVPVEAGTSFSIINHDIYYLDKALVNTGKGENYGVDITLERYLNKGYYWLVSGSLFNSRYMGGDGVWRDTKYNRGHIVNVLVGKEWMCGKHKQNVFTANIRLSYQGGDHYTPVDIARSESEHDIYFDQTQVFSKQFPSIFTSDITAGYKINKRRVSHEISLKVLNLGGSTGQHGYIYNERTKKVEKLEVKSIIPNLSYKVSF